jgi:putative transposase
MKKDKVVSLESRIEGESRSALDELVREGARKMLQDAIENEVAEYLERHGEVKDDQGRQAVVRNGSMPGRTLVTGAGPLAIRQPRVQDRREDHRFTSAILPPYLRRTPSVDALIPALYLKGISTGDFTTALEAILGENASGLSATNIVRLKQGWEEEYKEWSRRDLSGKRYVYWWADGIYFNVRLEDERTCMLVLMGTLGDGTKELIAVLDGFRESKDSWTELMRDLSRRGLKDGPKLAVGDGALGFWAALREMFPQAQEQRCWIHKTANVLDKMPKSLQAKAKSMIHEMYLAPTRKDALAAFDVFLETFEAKYPKASECLAKDKDVLFTFYDFPAEHWQHIRSTNPIESTFATVRHRTRRTKGCGSRTATLTMVFKLAREAEKHWRRINGYAQIVHILEGKKFVDGELKQAA